MAPSGFGPYHSMWLEVSQTKCIGVIPTPWVMTHALGLVSCHFLHSTSSWLRNRGQKMLRVGSAHQETFGGYIDAGGGVMARRKVSKLAKIIFSNQQRLVVALQGNGGVAQMGGDDDR